MDRDEIKEHLNLIRHISTRIETRRREVDAIRADIVSLSATDYSKDVVQGGKPCDISDGVIKLMEMEKNVMLEVDALLEIREKARVMFHRFTNVYAESVFVARYIDCYSWNQTARELKYSRRQVMNYHSEGIALLELDDKSQKELLAISRKCRNQKNIAHFCT